MLAALFRSLFRLVIEGQRPVDTNSRPADPPVPHSNRELAEGTAQVLRTGAQLNLGFRDYGGHGLCFKEGKFVFGPSIDGHIDSPSEAARARQQDDGRMEFDTEAAFVDWLELQLTDPAKRSKWFNISRLRLATAIGRLPGLRLGGKNLSNF